MITGEDETAGPQERYPAGRFNRLSGFIDDDQVESPLAKDLAVEAG